MAGVPFEPRETVRIAIVGTGLRGRSVLGEWMGVPNVRITALCDTVPEKVELAVQQMRKAGHDYEPARFTNGPEAYRDLVRRDDIDLLYTATPWEFHVPVALAAMKSGSTPPPRFLLPTRSKIAGSSSTHRSARSDTA